MFLGVCSSRSRRENPLRSFWDFRQTFSSVGALGQRHHVITWCEAKEGIAPFRLLPGSRTAGYQGAKTPDVFSVSQSRLTLSIVEDFDNWSDISGGYLKFLI